MSDQAALPSQGDVLHAIAGLVTARHSGAAFAHYPTLRIQTNNLHDVLSAAILSTDAVIDRWASGLSYDEQIAGDFQSTGPTRTAYRVLAPALARNVHRTASFLLEETRAIAAGGVSELEPPHQEWDRYCRLCGSRFVLHEIDVEADYVISNTGVGDVLGGDAPRIANLNSAMREKLLRIAEKHAPKDVEGVHFLLIPDLERCDEDTLIVPSVVSSVPNDAARNRCSLMAFVSAKSMDRCSAVRIICNCGQNADYRTASRTNVVECPRCHTSIGLLAVTGDAESVHKLNPDGTPSLAPIQGRNRFSVPDIAAD